MPPRAPKRPRKLKRAKRPKPEEEEPDRAEPAAAVASRQKFQAQQAKYRQQRIAKRTAQRDRQSQSSHRLSPHQKRLKDQSARLRANASAPYELPSNFGLPTPREVLQLDKQNPARQDILHKFVRPNHYDDYNDEETSRPTLLLSQNDFKRQVGSILAQNISEADYKNIDKLNKIVSEDGLLALTDRQLEQFRNIEAMQAQMLHAAETQFSLAGIPVPSVTKDIMEAHQPITIAQTSTDPVKMQSNADKRTAAAISNLRQIALNEYTSATRAIQERSRRLAQDPSAFTSEQREALRQKTLQDPRAAFNPFSKRQPKLRIPSTGLDDDDDSNSNKDKDTTSSRENQRKTSKTPRNDDIPAVLSGDATTPLLEQAIPLPAQLQAYIDQRQAIAKAKLSTEDYAIAQKQVLTWANRFATKFNEAMQRQHDIRRAKMSPGEHLGELVKRQEKFLSPRDHTSSRNDDDDTINDMNMISKQVTHEIAQEQLQNDLVERRKTLRQALIDQENAALRAPVSSDDPDKVLYGSIALSDSELAKIRKATGPSASQVSSKKGTAGVNDDDMELLPMTAAQAFMKYVEMHQEYDKTGRFVSSESKKNPQDSSISSRYASDHDEAMAFLYEQLGLKQADDEKRQLSERGGASSSDNAKNNKLLTKNDTTNDNDDDMSFIPEHLRHTPEAQYLTRLRKQYRSLLPPDITSKQNDTVDTTIQNINNDDEFEEVDDPDHPGQKKRQRKQPLETTPNPDDPNSLYSSIKPKKQPHDNNTDDDISKKNPHRFDHNGKPYSLDNPRKHLPMLSDGISVDWNNIPELRDMSLHDAFSYLKRYVSPSDFPMSMRHQLSSERAFGGLPFDPNDPSNTYKLAVMTKMHSANIYSLWNEHYADDAIPLHAQRPPEPHDLDPVLYHPILPNKHREGSFAFATKRKNLIESDQLARNAGLSLRLYDGVHTPRVRLQNAENLAIPGTQTELELARRKYGKSTAPSDQRDDTTILHINPQRLLITDNDISDKERPKDQFSFSHNLSSNDSTPTMETPYDKADEMFEKLRETPEYRQRVGTKFHDFTLTDLSRTLRERQQKREQYIKQQSLLTKKHHDDNDAMQKQLDIDYFEALDALKFRAEDLAQTDSYLPLRLRHELMGGKLHAQARRFMHHSTRIGTYTPTSGYLTWIKQLSQNSAQIDISIPTEQPKSGLQSTTTQTKMQMKLDEKGNAIFVDESNAKNTVIDMKLQQQAQQQLQAQQLTTAAKLHDTFSAYLPQLLEKEHEKKQYRGITNDRQTSQHDHNTPQPHKWSKAALDAKITALRQGRNPSATNTERVQSRRYQIAQYLREQTAQDTAFVASQFLQQQQRKYRQQREDEDRANERFLSPLATSTAMRTTTSPFASMLHQLTGGMFGSAPASRLEYEDREQRRLLSTQRTAAPTSLSDIQPRHFDSRTDEAFYDMYPRDLDQSTTVSSMIAQATFATTGMIRDMYQTLTGQTSPIVPPLYQRRRRDTELSYNDNDEANSQAEDRDLNPDLNRDLNTTTTTSKSNSNHISYQNDTSADDIKTNVFYQSASVASPAMFNIPNSRDQFPSLRHNVPQPFTPTLTPPPQLEPRDQRRNPHLITQQNQPRLNSNLSDLTVRLPIDNDLPPLLGQPRSFDTQQEEEEQQQNRDRRANVAAADDDEDEALFTSLLSARQRRRLSLEEPMNQQQQPQQQSSPVSSLVTSRVRQILDPASVVTSLPPSPSSSLPLSPSSPSISPGGNDGSIFSQSRTAFNSLLPASLRRDEALQRQQESQSQPPSQPQSSSVLARIHQKLDSASPPAIRAKHQQRHALERSLERASVGQTLNAYVQTSFPQIAQVLTTGSMMFSTVTQPSRSQRRLSEQQSQSPYQTSFTQPANALASRAFPPSLSDRRAAGATTPSPTNPTPSSSSSSLPSPLPTPLS